MRVQEQDGEQGVEAVWRARLIDQGAPGGTGEPSSANAPVTTIMVREMVAEGTRELRVGMEAVSAGIGLLEPMGERIGRAELRSNNMTT